MTELSAQLRTKETNLAALRKEDRVPAVLYGPEAKGAVLTLERKAFARALKEAGESSLVTLDIDGSKRPVFIHEVQHHPVSGAIVHVDFYEPSLTEAVEVEVPLVFEGEAPAVRDLGGTLIKQMNEVRVRALARDLPHEIRVNIATLVTFDDRIVVKDLTHESNVTILRGPDEMVAQAVPVEDVEAELARPSQEKVEDVQKVEKERKESATTPEK